MTMFPEFDHVTAEGDRFAVRAGWLPDEHSARCRSCDGLIVWVVTKSERRMPVDPAGTSHFATCPQAKEWRRR